MLSLCATAGSGFVPPSAVLKVPQAAESVVRTSLGPFMQFDEEGGMVKSIEEGGMTLEQVRAAYGAEGPKLSAEKQALCVLKEPEWNVNKMAVSATDEDFVLQTSSMGDAVCEIVVEPPFNTYEDYVVGFTAESSDKISIVHEESSDIEGRTDRRGGEPRRDLALLDGVADDAAPRELGLELAHLQRHASGDHALLGSVGVAVGGRRLGDLGVRERGLLGHPL